MTPAVAVNANEVTCILRSMSSLFLSDDLMSPSDREVLRWLGGVASMRDEKTGAHTARMASYTGAIAAAYGLHDAQVQLLVAAAPLHDIGKLGVPDSILNKPGSLTPTERERMKLHAQMGYDLLASSDSLVLQLGAEIALSHHERWDGAGYPRGLAREAIPLSGRIVALADCFDALTTVRSYKSAWSVDKSVDFIRNSDNGHFDPKVISAFLSCLPNILQLKDWYEFAADGDVLSYRFETIDAQALDAACAATH
jgi:response regulator RpfG family c-di-GMP phosphodiesterase